MNDVFNLSRFAKYYKYDLRNIISTFGLSFLTMTLAGLIIYAISLSYSLVFEHVWQGPQVEGRMVVFIILAIGLLISISARMYGFVTDKKMGTIFTMIPASVTEKYLSMLINVIILAPFLFVVVYLGVDYIICVLDPTCGEHLFSKGLLQIVDIKKEINPQMEISYFKIIMNYSSMMLCFLLGAMWFKKYKVAGVVLAWFILFAIAVALMGVFVSGDRSIDFLENVDVVALAKTFNVANTIFTILFFVGMLTAVFFRVKTIKH